MTTPFHGVILFSTAPPAFSEPRPLIQFRYNFSKMSGACSTNGEKMNAYSIGGKARRKETTGKTKT
jgi:hypothetical protein